MKSYEGWSFRDRSFVTALGLSILWHAFWFFSLTIVVNPKKKPIKSPAKIVSLGSVLDDKIFRTLVEARPELSKTFYRRLSDFSSPAEVQVQKVERYTPGSVVSLPFGMKTWNKMKSLIGGSKASPEHEFAEKFDIKFADESLGIEGELKNRSVLSHPQEPTFPEGMEPFLKNTEVVISFSVDGSGSVSETQVVSSSGSPDLDLLWTRYLRNWQFTPLDLDPTAQNQKGTIRFRFPEPSEERE